MRSILEVCKMVRLVGEAEHIKKETRNKDIDVPSPCESLTK